MNASLRVRTLARTHSKTLILALALSLADSSGLWDCMADSTSAEARLVETPPTNGFSSFYSANRSPLTPNPLLKLPIGSITPRGWLRHQLELEANGMIGHLPEISKWCKFESNAWASTQGEGHSGWEELPYWLKGYGDLGYVLKDEAIIKTARKWIDAVLASREPDGWFGPRSLKTSLEGKPDLWPHMVMANALQSFYEATRDERVLPFLSNYFQWLNTQPGTTFGAGYWPRIRFGDNIETIYWLYNRTNQSWLLDLAKRIHQNMENWTSGVHNWHNVNVSQGFREPAIYYQQARERRFLEAAERNYLTVMNLYGQFPGGGFAGDENCRPGFTDPRQGFETCGIVEFMHSFEMLTKISGNSLWADRCEELAFNSLPAAMTPDFKGLHYLTCANQVQLDKNNKAPAIQNGGTMFSYSPLAVYRCCQHNVSHGWPYYAEELWLTTLDGGICLSLYAASEVIARVGDGSAVRIVENTDYPFSDTVNLSVFPAKAVVFPLYLRIPRWCDGASAQINGQAVPFKSRPGQYLVLERAWKERDIVTLKFPMHLDVRRWKKNNNAASIDYGPLTFSLKIGERWSQYGGSADWPEFEVFPTTPWNYALLLDEKAASRSLNIVKTQGPCPEEPFTPQTSPIRIKAKGRRIAAWQLDSQGLIGKLQPSPVRSGAPDEEITLIPMGAARLRVSSFPVIGSGTNAHEWTVPKPLSVSASHCYEGDTVEALIDGIEPKTSNDQTIPRFTWWDHRGTTEWVQREFEQPRKISAVEVYWFDDTGTGSCRVPASWRLFYKTDGRWKPVDATSGFGTNRDTYNKLTFKPLQTTGLRLEANLQPNYSGGILEWKQSEELTKK